MSRKNVRPIAFAVTATLLLANVLLPDPARVLPFVPRTSLAAAASDDPVARVSISTSGVEGNGDSRSADVSADGRFVVFSSKASNLVGNDTNGVEDVYLYDRAASTLARVSVSSNGAQANGPSTVPAISGDGRWITFNSSATNLVVGDTNASQDIFLYDRLSKATTRVSVTSSGQQTAGDSFGPAYLSVDGRYIVFITYADLLGTGAFTGSVSGYRYDRTTASVGSLCLLPNGSEGRGCVAPTLSDDGRYVSFESSGSGLVPGDTNATKDVFVRDMVAATTTRVSVDTAGAQANGYSDGASISGNGQFVAFRSFATNLVPGDTNAATDVFVRDVVAGITQRVSLASSGTQGNGDSMTAHGLGDGGSHALSRDGRSSCSAPLRPTWSPATRTG